MPRTSSCSRSSASASSRRSPPSSRTARPPRGDDYRLTAEARRKNCPKSPRLRVSAVRSETRYGSAVGLFLLLLLFLAADAHGGDRAGLDAVHRDLLFADLADPEG